MDVLVTIVLDALVSSSSMWWYEVGDFGYFCKWDVYFGNRDLPGVDCVSAILRGGGKSHALFFPVPR